MIPIILLVLVGTTSAFFRPHSPSGPIHFNGDAGPKAFLTPFIKNAQIKQARELSLVTGLEPDILSYSGFITVNETCGSNLFFWFFPSQNNWEKDPVSVWLQGGPGSTSFFGLLTENGPYNLRLDGQLEAREYAWNRNSSIIYIDNPVGTGYSFTNNPDCYASNQSDVGRDLLNAFEQFFQMFPEISSNPFYLTGESYAGKYIPAAAYAILQSKSKINLQGLLIGNGLVDPENQQLYSSYLYQLGLIDSKTRDSLQSQEDSIREEISKGNFGMANDLSGGLFYSFFEASGYGSLYNHLYPNGEPEADIDTFVTKAAIREAIHVGNATWNNGGMVYSYLYEDVMKSVRPWLQELLENYRVTLYNGQLDIIVAYPLTLGFVQKLEWSGAEDYKTASRQIWTVDGDVAGFSKTSKNFTEVLVRNAGHMVPTNQPKWAFDLYQKFISNRSL